jgi:hypothetical protein
MSSGSRTRLPAKVGSGAAMCPEAPDSLGRLQSTTYLVAPDPTSQRGGFQAATCPAVPCGPWASSMKKSLVGLLVHKVSPVPNTRRHVSKEPDVRAIMGLQDMRASTAVNACKTCCYSAASALLTTRLSLLQCRVTR